MPRILRIINRFNLGGPTYNVGYLTKYLSPEFETMLVGGEKDETEDSSEFIIRNLGIEPIIIPEMRREINPKNDFIAYQKIKKIIQEYRPDIVHTHAAKAGTLGRLAATSCKVPVIVHTFHGHVFHSYFNKYKTELFKNIERNLAGKSSKIIAISDLQKEELSKIHRICEPEKIKVIPLGFDLSKFRINNEEKRKLFRERYMIAQEEVAIGIIGRIVPIKNHRLFLEAINYLIKNSHKKFKAFIVGDGEDRMKMETLAKELGIEFNNEREFNPVKPLTFTSWIKNIDEVYAGIDIVALTSLNEGTPVSLIEAQAADKPIVSTNVGGIEDVVIPGITALLSNSDNHFFENLMKVVNNDDVRNDMSKKGWQHVKEVFHYTRLVDETANLYRDLLYKKELKYF